MKALTSRQYQLAEAYIRVGGVVSVAAKEAGMDPRNAQRDLAKPHVAAYVNARQHEIAARNELSEDRTIQGLMQSAFWDPADFALVKSPEDVAKLPREARAAIQGWKWDAAGNFVLLFAPRVDALDKLMKHQGLYTADRVNPNDAPETIFQQALWRFIGALHVHRGMDVHEAIRYGEEHPEEVEAWALEAKVLKVPVLNRLKPGREIVVPGKHVGVANR